MFPQSSVASHHVAPLTHAEFLQRVLVPEAAVALIQEDTSKSRLDAIQILRDSAEYGSGMFPDTSREGDSAAEALLKSRLLKEAYKHNDAHSHSTGPEEVSYSYLVLVKSEGGYTQSTDAPKRVRSEDLSPAQMVFFPLAAAKARRRDCRHFNEL